jgi:hypothetical protein
MRIYWGPSTVNGCVAPLVCNRPSLVVDSNSFLSRHALLCRTVNFFGVIPGGKSFAIPEGTLSGNVTGEVANNETGIGFPWTINIPGGTTILFVGSDDRGMGTGGSAQRTILDSQDTSCLDSSSPSSTAGSPAGGSYATSTGSTLSSNSGEIHS